MASAHTNTTSSDKMLEDLIKCPICLDYYNDPRCLPCSHTFCYQCIKDLCQSGVGQCPMRDNSYIFEGSIDRLPINRIAKDLVECIKKSSSSNIIKCDECKQILSEFICETCSKNFCTICLQLEHDLNQLKTHEINIIINKNLNHFCSKHIGEKQKYWCTICQEIVCSDCLLFEHRQHSFITLEAFAKIIKSQFNLYIKEIIHMKGNLEELNHQISQTHRKFRHNHSQTINQIEQTFKNLESILEQRKRYLINLIKEKDSHHQSFIEEQKNNIEQHIKSLFIRELLSKQLLNIEDHFQLIQSKNDFINYHQLIQQEYQQLIDGWILDFQHFNIDENLSQIQFHFENFGSISTETFLTDQKNIYPLIKLGQDQVEEKYLEFNENYAYGYRFQLRKSLFINTIYVKILFNNDLNVYILDHNDILIEKKIVKSNNQDLTSTKWIKIPIKYQIENNFYIFIWSQSNQKLTSSFAYQESNQNLHQINQQISVRPKRARIDPSTNVQINDTLSVIYDALFNDKHEKDKTVPAIQMIIHPQY